MKEKDLSESEFGIFINREIELEAGGICDV